MQDVQSTRSVSVDTGDLYERTRREFVTTVRSRSSDELAVLVPATPAWCVRDVLAHVVGLAADLNAQRFPAADDDGTAWTNAQVERWRSRTLRELLAEWEREAPAFEDGLRAFGYEMGSHFVADLHAHHQDVRGALHLPAATDDLTVRVALDHYLAFLHDLLVEEHWGTLDLVADGEERRVGVPGPHRARLQAQPFELLRSFSGRRSGRQIRALDWDGDVDAFLAFLDAGLTRGYALPEADIVE